MTILELQRALLAKGFNPGPLDGVAGARTRKAIREFQKANGLTVDGIAGPKTMAKLTGKSKAGSTTEIQGQVSIGDVPADLSWLSEAKRLVGTTEVKGPKSNPDIIAMTEATGILYDNDDIPWCGLFVAHCIASSLPDEALPLNPLGARQWLKFGKEVDPQFGSVLVFYRGSKDGWQGHVGFYWAEDEFHYHVLGGNQSNSVNVSRLAKSRLLGARWPETVASRGIRRMMNGSTIKITENED